MSGTCSTELIALGGVVLGFFLGEGSRLIRDKLRINRHKELVRKELAAIKTQLVPKKDILQKAISKLKNNQILPTLSVHFITHGYDNTIKELYSHLTRKERQCLHVIYENLRVADLTMDRFESEIMVAIEKGVMDDPYEAFRDRFDDILNTLVDAESLIDGYLKGDPPDVFAVS